MAARCALKHGKIKWIFGNKFFPKLGTLISSTSNYVKIPKSSKLITRHLHLSIYNKCHSKEQCNCFLILPPSFSYWLAFLQPAWRGRRWSWLSSPMTPLEKPRSRSGRRGWWRRWASWARCAGSTPVL